MSALLRGFAVLAILLVVAACGSTGKKRVPFDYRAYVARNPRSVVVAPVVGLVGPSVPHWFLSTITQPLAERGYYVFPVFMSEQVAAEAGLTGSSAQVGFEEASTERAIALAELFDADSVLFATIRKWETRQANVLTQWDGEEVSTVEIEYLLVSDSGEPLWSAWEQVSYTEEASDGLTDAILTGLWKSMIGTFRTTEQRQTLLAGSANRSVIYGRTKTETGATYYTSDPMLVGPYHVRYEADRTRRREQTEP